jgi:ABC-2 type transport system permease protein
MPSRFRIRLWWVGYTTFVIRAFQDIVRYSILTIAPSAITTALYFAVFGELIARRIGSVDGIEYRQYIAPGLIMMPVIATSYSQTALSFFTAKFHGILDEHLMSPQPGWMIVLSYVSGGLLRGFLVGLAAASVVLLFAHTHIQHAAAMAAGFLLVSLLTSLAGFVNAVLRTPCSTWSSCFVGACLARPTSMSGSQSVACW